MGGAPASYIKPVPTPPLCPWGRYPSGGIHRALDYPTPVGTPFRCAMGGVVTVASWSSTGFGNHIRVRLDDGNTVIYGHLNRYFVKVGQRVTAGQILGHTGNTGRSTGPHLHMEVRRFSYVPLSAWDFTSRLVNYKTPTTTTTVEKDWFDMATPQDFENVLKNLLVPNGATLSDDKWRVAFVEQLLQAHNIMRDPANPDGPRVTPSRVMEDSSWSKPIAFAAGPKSALQTLADIANQVGAVAVQGEDDASKTDLATSVAELRALIEELHPKA